METDPESAGGGDAGNCAVCREAARTVFHCPDCATPHHPDCWEYNGGCAFYGCARTPNWRPTQSPAEEDARPEGKILLSHLAFGSYDGVYYVPWLAATLTILAELVGLLGPLMGFAWMGWGLAAMCGFIAWIAVSAERYYLDLDERRITKAKVVLGKEVLEWQVLPLANVSRLALVPLVREDGHRQRFVLAAVDREDGLLPLAPPFLADTAPFLRARELLVKLKSNNVFPIEIPTAARVGASEEVLQILDSRGIEEPPTSPEGTEIVEEPEPEPGA